MAGMVVDPELVSQAYKQMLAEANSQVALLQAAVSQLQSEVNSLRSEVEELKENNEELMAASGRQDGIPQEEPPVSS